MSEKEYIKRCIKETRGKLARAAFLKHVLAGLTAGLAAAALTEGISLIIPFYFSHLLAVLFTAAGLTGGIIYSLLHKKSEKDAAVLLDSFGLKERVITALEHEDEDDETAVLLRRDAAETLRRRMPGIKIKTGPWLTRIMLFLCMLMLAFCAAFTETPAKEQAAETHEVKKEAKVKKEEIEKSVDVLKELEAAELTEGERTELSQMLESLDSSIAEMQDVATAEDLKTASDKLDYRYEAIANGLERMKEEEEAKERAGENGSASGNSAGKTTSEMLADAMDKLGDSSDAFAKADGKNEGGEGKDGENGNGEGDGDGENGNDSGEGQNGKDGENGDGTGEGKDGQNGKEGNGSGEGQNGKDGANGNGNSKDGSNGGAGQSDYGHGNAEGDYVSLDNPTGDDSALSGKRDKEGDSKITRDNSGIGFEGEHVKLENVIGEYSKKAYEGIEKGTYPSGMEDVIKDYFSSFD